MGLFDKFKKAAEAASATAPSKPASIEVAGEPNTVYAPVSGKVVSMKDIPDPVFNSGALGDGCGIWPEGEVVFSPVAGTISATTGTLHAVGITSEDGVEVLVHVGIDTVDMNGKGFTCFVTKGQAVKAGEALMSFSKADIKAADHGDVVVVAITNSTDFPSVELTASGDVQAGQPVVSIKR